jgi:hypothetical protein
MPATNPTLGTATVPSAGTTLTATLSESCLGGNIAGSAGFTLTGTTATISSWTITGGTAFSATLTGKVTAGQTVKLSYDSTQNILSNFDYALLAFSLASVTNNSTQTTAPTYTTLEQSIRDRLKASSAFTYVPVRPLLGAQAGEVPLVTYEITERGNFRTFDGTGSAVGDVKQSGFEVGILASTYDDCIGLSNSVAAVLSEASGTVSGITFLPCAFQGQGDVEQGFEPGGERPVWLRTQQYSVLWREAV